LRLLGTENVLLRSYAPPDQNDTPVLFCLTFSAGNHRVAHPPEVCYEGQGWTVDRNKESILEFPGGGHAAMKVQHLSISRGGRTQEVIIWFRNGSSDTSSFFQQKVEMLLSSLFGHHPWTAMIRLSAVTESGEAQQALESIASFGAALLPYLDALSQKMETP
ncbi:MAG: exosortase C-terminal domain/associated protein EpsI, partial [Planctomycetota bacterium]